MALTRPRQSSHSKLVDIAVGIGSSSEIMSFHLRKEVIAWPEQANEAQKQETRDKKISCLLRKEVG